MKGLLSRLGEPAYAAMRIVLAFVYMSHGLQKWFGLFGGARMPLTSLYGVAGVLEVLLGGLLVIGLFTREAAFVASGEMAFAYFISHAPRGSLPVQNGGDLAVVLCFAFLYIATRGGGWLSVDAAARR